MEENNNILSRYDAVAKQAVNFDIDAQRWYTVYDLKCQIALALGADVQDVNDCLSVYDVDYLIYKTYGGQLSKLDLISDYDVLVATIAILDSGIDISLIDSEYIAEMMLVDLIVPVQDGYFYVEPLNDNTEFTIYSENGAPVLNLEYSSDGKTWQSWDYKTNHITANAQERVYLRGQNKEWTTTESTGTEDIFNKLHYNSIISMSDAQFNIGGRLSSLFTGTEDETVKSIIMSAIFYNSSCRDASKLIVPRKAKLSYAFKGCSSLISAPKTLSDGIFHANQYKSMFDGCTSLTKAPKLPATKLQSKCYQQMFANCKSLTNAPELPATSLRPYCYSGMFKECNSLINPPKLSATEMQSNSYEQMFVNCKSLTNAPELPATSLRPYCYFEMFRGCSSLTSFNFGNQSILANSSNSLWNMFFNCSKLSYIRCLYDLKNSSGPSAYMNWTSGVASQGTFITNTNKWERGVDGIPNGWEVVIEGASA